MTPHQTCAPLTRSGENGTPAAGNLNGRGPALLWLVIASVLLFAGASRLSAQSVPAKEYQLKAAFLFNFAHFVDWPAGAQPQSPLIIGVLGDDPFGSYLDGLVQGEKVNNRPLVVERFHHVDEIKNCQILFISQSEEKRLLQIFPKLNGRNILTVGEGEDFAREGGMIRFRTDNGKIRFRINMDAAKAANLTLSSKLLRPAEVVTSEKK